MNRFFLILPAIILALCFHINSCNHQLDEKWVKMSGPNDPTSLVFFYKKDATYEQKQEVENTIIHYPHPESKGYYLQDGIAGIFSVRNSGYEGYAIQFSTEATPEQRERLKKNIRESPLVYKVYENVIPAEIKDL